MRNQMSQRIQTNPFIPSSDQHKFSSSNLIQSLRQTGDRNFFTASIPTYLLL